MRCIIIFSTTSGSHEALPRDLVTTRELNKRNDEWRRTEEGSKPDSPDYVDVFIQTRVTTKYVVFWAHDKDTGEVLLQGHSGAIRGERIGAWQTTGQKDFHEGLRVAFRSADDPRKALVRKEGTKKMLIFATCSVGSC